MKKNHNNEDNYDNDDYINDEFSENQEEFSEDYDDDEYSEGFDDDEFLDDSQKSKNIKDKSKKEYYVKGADLIAEIKKYKDSKLSNPEGRGYISEELRIDDSQNLHKIFHASEILPDIPIEMNL